MQTLLKPESVVPGAEKRRVLIVDDHNFFAACLRTLLDNESDLAVCDITTTSAELGARIARLKPDILVIDLSLRTEGGLQLGRRLREMGVLTPILFTSSLERPSNAQLETVPYAAFVAKSKRPVEFLAALRAALSPAGVPPGALGSAFPFTLAQAKA